MDFYDRNFKIPAAFQALTGVLQHFTVKTAVKIAEEEGDSDEAKLAARNELMRLIEAIETIAEPVIASVGKDGDKFVLKFSFEHDHAVKSVEAFAEVLNQTTYADKSVRFEPEVTESKPMF